MYKRINIIVLSALLVFSPLMTYSPPAQSSGIPTVDIAALVQKLLDYAQKLKDFAEQLYQSQVIANEYIQKLKQMEQTYREYEHTLEQIKGLKEYVDNKEWKKILAQIDLDFPLNPFDSHWDDWSLDVYTDDGVIEVDKRIGTFYKRIRNLDDVYEDIEKVFKSDDVIDQAKEEARRHFNRSREYTEQKYAAAVFKKEAEYLNRALKKIKQYRADVAMGDEAELRTLQTMALQQELNLAYRKAQNDILIKNFDMANQQAIQKKNHDSYVYDMMLRNKLAVSQSKAYEPNDSRKRSANF